MLSLLFGCITDIGRNDHVSRRRSVFQLVVALQRGLSRKFPRKISRYGQNPLSVSDGVGVSLVFSRRDVFFHALGDGRVGFPGEGFELSLVQKVVCVRLYHIIEIVYCIEALALGPERADFLVRQGGERRKREKDEHERDDYAAKHIFSHNDAFLAPGAYSGYGAAFSLNVAPALLRFSASRP